MVRRRCRLGRGLDEERLPPVVSLDPSDRLVVVEKLEGQVQVAQRPRVVPPPRGSQSPSPHWGPSLT